jgi:hypothetical protein
MILQNPNIFGFKVTYLRGRRAVKAQEAKSARIELPKSGQQLFIKVPKKMVDEAIERFGLNRPKVVYINRKGEPISKKNARTALVYIPKSYKSIEVPIPQGLKTRKSRDGYIGDLQVILSGSVEPVRRKPEKKAAEDFSFKEEYVDKVIDSKKLNKRVAVRKYLFTLPGKYEIMSKSRVKEDVFFPFLVAMEEAFGSLFKRHGKKKYFVRILQDATRMGTQHEGKGWGGYTLQREEITSLNSMRGYLGLLAELYYESLEAYSKSRPLGTFSVFGFTIEVVL